MHARRQRSQLVTGALGLIAGLAAAGAALPGAAQEVAEGEGGWDQQRVTELAAELDATIRELLADPGLEARQPSALQARRHHSAIVAVRELSGRATELAARLRAGRGLDQTRGIWQQMLMVRDDVRYYAEESTLPKSVNEKARRAGELTREIEPYYAAE